MSIVEKERCDSDAIHLEYRSKTHVVLVVTIAYLLVGPPIGNVVFTLLIALESFLGAVPAARPIGGTSFSTLGLMFALGMPLSYLVGGAPALVCGLLAGLVQAHGREVRTDVLVLFAFVASVAIRALADHPGAPTFGEDAIVWLRTFAVLAAPALICRRLTAGTVYRPPAAA